jgi:hypothetical protein
VFWQAHQLGYDNVYSMKVIQLRLEDLLVHLHQLQAVMLRVPLGLLAEMELLLLLLLLLLQIQAVELLLGQNIFMSSLTSVTEIMFKDTLPLFH